jgi:uncharacterized protein with FMN-binding domain
MTTRPFATVLIGLLAAGVAGCATAQIVGGPVPANRLVEGIYDGSAENGPVRVTTEVRIENHRIACIEVTEHRNWKGGAAEKVVPGRIIAAQSTRVDAVSGATASSIAIMNAVEAAIRKAR